ncbi:MAG: M56 family metallopeptidase, partial [Bacteroidales bacterium]|nr:M56 family metallopeptidase [Bacteroidales bacterium]
MNFSLRQSSSLIDPVLGIAKFRNYYEELIRMSDADFGSEPGIWHRQAGNNPDDSGLEELGAIPSGRTDSLDGDPHTVNRISVAGILLIIYIAGVMFFFIRFIYLIIRLYLLALKSGFSRQEGFRLVEIQEEISPFSFFRFLFINNGFFDESELQNVLEHEKAHIRQKHSMDHLFAHGLAVFQWFNPFAWQIRNALKTTHEYIADKQVIDRGFEMFNYQSLLLKQVIGYHSVELVNNFNLKPIKKRINMMNKTRSGVPAKLKAMLVIPFALFIFFLFAEFTLKGPGNRFMDLNASMIENKKINSMTGLWERYKGIPGGNVYNPMGLIYISEDKFSYLEGFAVVKEYFWRLEQDNLVLSYQKGAPGIELKVDYDGEELNIWWNDSKYQTYRKTAACNTLDRALKGMDVNIDPPEISQYRILDRKLTYSINLGYREDGSVVLLFNGQPTEIDDLPDIVEDYRSDRNK